MAAATSAEQPAPGGRDRDPPPSFDGSSPEEFKVYLKELELWQWETDIPRNKHAVKIFRQLGGIARAAAQEIDLEVLKSERGVKAIISKLEEHFQPHTEAAMPKAFERAVYGEARKARESLQDFIIRMDRNFKELADEQVPLADEVKGYIMFRQASLTQMQEDQVVTWTQGQYQRDKVVKALRKLEKVQKEKGGKHFVMEEGEVFVNDPGMESDPEGGDSDQFVYVGEGDLDQIFEEGDLHHALATYQQVRRAIKDQKNARGFPFGGVKGKGKGKSGKGDDRAMKRVHVEQLKLRTRCARCGAIGHWAKECTGAMDDYARQKANSTAASSSTGKSYTASMSGKSGFCEVGGDRLEGSQFHSLGKVGITLGECLVRHIDQHQHPDAVGEFCGLSTMASHGIVDTAAQNGLVGHGALVKLESALRSHGLRISWSEKTGCARGVGGSAKVVGVAEIPLGLGGINGILETTVVQDDVPLLIPVNLLQNVQAKIDLKKCELEMQKFEVKVPMQRMPSGHFSISVLEFAKDGWEAPKEAVARGRQTCDFTLAAAMSSIRQVIKDPRRQPDHDDQVFCGHGDIYLTEGKFSAPAASFALASGGEKASGMGQRVSTLRGGWSLARRWIALWVLASCAQSSDASKLQPDSSFAWISGAYRQARVHGPADPVGCAAWAEEMCKASQHCAISVQPLAEELGRRRQSASEGGLVSRVSHEVESCNNSTHGGAKDSSQEEHGKHRESQQPSERRTVSGNAISGSSWGGMPVRHACRAHGGEEGWTNEGAAFLQVPPQSVRVFPLGSERDRRVEEPRSHDECNRDTEHEREAGESTREAEGEGGNASCDAGKNVAGGTTNDGDGSDSSRCPSLGDPAGERASPPVTGGIPAESADVDDDGGRRGTSATGHDRSHSAPRDSGKSYGDEETVGTTEHVSIKGPEERNYEDEEMKHAPWATKILHAAAWNTAAKRQIEDMHLPESMREVHQFFWIKEASEWKFHHGILPEVSPRSEVMIAVTPQGTEEHYLDEIDRTLQKGCRKRLSRKMEEIKVSELYSRPRVSKEAQRQGMQAGTSFDLLTGFDLSKQEDQIRCMRILKEEDPDLITISPPCGPFSMVQNLNYPKMDVKKAMCIITAGVAHLEFAMKVFEWQVRRGKWALFEHPKEAASWKEPCVQRAWSLEGVERVVGDQCQYGLRVRPEEELNMKPTGFLSNSPRIRNQLSRRCSGDHPHQHLMGGRAKKAEEYPPKLCQAMIRGLKEEITDSEVWIVNEEWLGEGEDEGDLEDMLDEEVEQAGQEVRVGESAAPEDKEDVEEEEEGLPQKITAADKRRVAKLHANLGHPSTPDFCRALRMAKAREEVVRYVKQEFSCDVCKAHQKPKPARPSAIPQHYESGKVVGVDIVFFPGVQPRESVPVLNIIDWATCYQMLEPLEGKSAQHVWTKFQQSWARTFGIPEIIVVDQGREFLGEFGKQANESGALVRTIGARAPWQQGRTERHGGLAKEVFLKVREQVQPEGAEEWKQCIYSTEMAKNRLFNRSGFSPAQRQLGINVRLPGSLAGDDVYDANLMKSTATSQIRRTLEMRDTAMTEFLRHTTREAIAKGQRARTRIRKSFQPGDKVFVYRKPLPRRGDDVERERRRAVWCGPGAVILQEGPNVWISMRGELWKCAMEQVRSATSEEEEAFGLLREEFEELAKDLKRKGSRRGFKDITKWAIPEEDEIEESSLEGGRKRKREDNEEAVESDHQDEEEDPGGPPLPMEDDEDDDQGSSEPTRAQVSARTGTSSSSTSSSSSTAEEESAAAPAATQVPLDESAQEAAAARSNEGIAIPAQQMEQAIQSVRHNEGLDGTLPRNPAFGPASLRSRLSEMRYKPYTHGWWTLEEEEFEAQMKDTYDEDFWEMDEGGTILRRYHVHDRKWKFGPSEKKGCPIKAVHLMSTRRTVRKFQDGDVQEVVDDWRKGAKTEGPPRSWSGFTEFYIKNTNKARRAGQSYISSKSSDEVKEEDIKPEEWAEWRKADAEEWAKVAASGAVRVMSTEESKEVERQLRETGAEKRILPSRVVRRWKPSEQPGQAPSRKSRWCVRGDKDPDLLMLDRYAPTVTTAVVSIALQVAASYGFRGAVGDLKNAFMQSDKLRRKEG